MDGDAIDVPDDLLIVPIETIVMEILGGVEAELIFEFVALVRLGIVVELDFGGVLA